MTRSTSLLSAALVLILASIPSSVITQQRPPARDIELPPISFACPMNGAQLADGSFHKDVIEDKEGICPICQMALVAVRLDSIWTCPVHSVIHEKNPGICPIDKRDLVQMTVALSFTCEGHNEIDQITPGKCPDGTAMIAKYTPRPHGNHNPQHGGQFFMAPDNWHHVEGVFPRAQTVRIYLYDDFTKPLPLDQAKLVSGRVVTKETFDATTRTSKETAAFPVKLSSDGTYLETKVDSQTAPAQMAAKLKVKPDGPEYRFDFSFTEFSKEPAAAAAPTQVVKAPPPAPASAKPAAAPPVAAAATAPPPATPPAAAPPANANQAPASASAAAPVQAPPVQAPAPSTPAPGTTPQILMPGQNPLIPAMVNPALINVKIPDTVPEIVAEINTRDKAIRDLVAAGRFADVWLPAFEAKDLGLALGSRSSQLPTYKRRLLDPAVSRLMHAAWMLDAFGDLGNREQITAAYGNFDAAVNEITALFQ